MIVRIHVWFLKSCWHWPLWRLWTLRKPTPRGTCVQLAMYKKCCHDVKVWCGTQQQLRRPSLPEKPQANSWGSTRGTSLISTQTSHVGAEFGEVHWATAACPWSWCRLPFHPRARRRWVVMVAWHGLLCISEAAGTHGDYWLCGPWEISCCSDFVRYQHTA